MRPPLLLTVVTILLLLLPSPSHSLGSASTVAIIDSTGAVCAILAGPRTIQCAVPGSPRPQSLLPNISFDAVSGGRDFLCGLRSGGRTLLCWNAAGNITGGGFTLRRLYAGDAALQDVSVGSDQVSAVRNGSGVVFWRGARDGFPTAAPGAFRSLTSGNGFSCAVARGNDSVRCWGRSGGAIQSAFVNTSISSIAAGDSHVCGISSIGFVLCKGSNSSGQSNAPPGPAFEFSSLALGAAHSCAIRQQNGTVVCWGDHVAAPAKNTSFVFLTAGGNLTCGLASKNFSVVCWRPDGSDPLAGSAQLPRIQPGLCIADERDCQCGPFPDSGSFCSGSGIICNPCSYGDRDSLPASPPAGPTPPPAAARRGRSKGFLAFMIVGAVGGFAGLCTILYWLYIGICRQKRVHNSVQPTIAAPAGGNGGSSPAGSDPAANFSSPSLRTRSRVFRRQGSSAMRRQRSGPSRCGSHVQHSSFKSPEEFAFSDLAAATKGFANENKIGAGSFGTVYKGKLPDGREVAIKRSETVPDTKKWQEKESAFQSELAFLSRLHHKHLVGLVGFCEEGEERLLVYDYMNNGSLYDHLHPAAGGAGADEINSWKMRIKILLDAARGVEYLHTYAEPPIIHRDIKSSNILLDGSWTGRVSDFGLSLAGGEGGQQLSMKAAGTVGYMDPEYYGLQQLTAKSDVYGLGVVMLETLTGKRAIFKGEGGGGDGLPESVVDYAVPSIVDGGLGRVLDQRVGPPGASEADAVELVAYTAVRCVSLEGRERPAMSDVVDNLESALALCEDGPASFSSASARSGRSAD